MEEKFLKLTSAVYKVLEYFPESDPLKSRAKTKALAIMDNLVLCNEGTKQWLLEDIDLLLGYLKIGRDQGWMSATNYLIISNQYEELKKDISQLKESAPKPISADMPIIPLQPAQTPREPILLDSASIKKAVAGAQPKAQAFLSSRHKKILEFLKKRETAQVMDLQTVLTDVTKRTIRRDLDELLKMGKISRQGEWNQVVYRIV